MPTPTKPTSTQPISADAIAALAEKGEDVSSFFTGKGRMIEPVQPTGVEEFN